MSSPLSRSDFERLPKTLLNKGRIFNADVWLIEHQGQSWVIKDFRRKPFFYRWTVGTLTARHECRVVKHLQGLEGIPGDPFLLDRYAWACRHIESTTLRDLSEKDSSWPAFFQQLEAATRAMHSHGIAHLDLRNARNILVTPAHSPYLIDFQSALFTRHLPRFFRRTLEKIDLSGIYKHWLQRDEATLGPEREAILAWHIRSRRWWPWRGYRLPGHRRLYENEKRLRDRVQEREDAER